MRKIYELPWLNYTLHVIHTRDTICRKYSTTVPSYWPCPRKPWENFLANLIRWKDIFCFKPPLTGPAEVHISHFDLRWVQAYFYHLPPLSLWRLLTYFLTAYLHADIHTGHSTTSWNSFNFVSYLTDYWRTTFRFFSVFFKLATRWLVIYSDLSDALCRVTECNSILLRTCCCNCCRVRQWAICTATPRGIWRRLSYNFAIYWAFKYILCFDFLLLP